MIATNPKPKVNQDAKIPIDRYCCLEKCHMRLMLSLQIVGHNTRGGHSIVKLNTMCGQNKFTFGKLHHQNESKFYQFFFMSRYTWYLLHIRK